MRDVGTPEILMVLGLVMLCGVSGFTGSPVRSTPCGPNSLQFRARLGLYYTQRPITRQLTVPRASEGGVDDGTEDYKKKLADFMAQAHEKRLQAMDALKAEVQRGFEDQISELQSQLAESSASASASPSIPIQKTEPALAGSAAGAGISRASVASLVRPTHHPAYAARQARPGWEARWGPEEIERASIWASMVTAADATSIETEAAGIALPGGSVHPAYGARTQRPGWEARWGAEEPARIAFTTSPAAAVDAPVKQTSTVALPADVHPAYAARAQRPGWEARWGAEEPARMASAMSPAAAVDASVKQTLTAALPADVHPAYAAARAQRPGWEARWGAEEPARVASASSPTAAVEVPVKQTSTAALPAGVHPAYAARAQRPGWEARWGAEEPARMASTTSPADVVDASVKQTSTAALPADVHPAYAARLQRPGWDARWGSEEKDRVEGARAGAIAVEGAAAGFATAGGLDTKVESTPADGADAAAATSTDQSLVGESLPDDVSELRELVASFRQNFQGYMLRSQQESNELRSAKTKIDGEVSRLNANLAAEKELRTNLQESFLAYMTRSGVAGADKKMRMSHLESYNARLAAEAEELRRFTQEYMVKASREKQNAVEAAIANERAQARARIEELEEEVIRLQPEN